VSDSRHITIRGITFRYAANFAQHPMVRAGTGWRFEDTVVEWANAGGLGVVGDDVVLLRVTARHNGQAGLVGWRIKNLLIKDSVQWDNNWKGFRPSNEASTKFTRTDRVRIENLTSYANTGPGIWFDWNNTNIVIEGCTIYGNRGLRAGWEGVGIFIEASQGPVTIRNTLVYSNTGAGIGLAESQNVVVEDNTLVDNGTNLELRAMEGRANHRLANIVVRNNRFKNARQSEISTSLGTWSRGSVHDKQLSFDGNRFDLQADGTLFKWAGEALHRLDDVRSALAFEANGAIRPFPFDRPLVASRPIAEQKSVTIGAALARIQEGGTAIIPVNGRSALQRVANGWAFQVYDLANQDVHLSVQDLALRRALEDRLTPFPLAQPVMLRVKLLRRTADFIEAIALGIAG